MQEKKSIFAPNKIVAIIIYVAVMFIIASLITIGIGSIICRKNNLDFILFSEALSATDFTKFDPRYIEASAIAQGYGNFFGYLIAFIGVTFFMRDELKSDLSKMKANKFKYPIYAILFFVLTFLVDFLFQLIVESSVNQSTIELILNYSGKYVMIIAVVVFAPIVEELIYRKAIFSLTKGNRIYVSYLISIVLFTLPHMLSSDMSNIFVWILQSIPYMFSAFLFCLIYHKSNFDIYSTIFAHILNNLIAVVLSII